MCVIYLWKYIESIYYGNISKHRANDRKERNQSLQAVMSLFRSIVHVLKYLCWPVYDKKLVGCWTPLESIGSTANVQLMFPYPP